MQTKHVLYVAGGVGASIAAAYLAWRFLAAKPGQNAIRPHGGGAQRNVKGAPPPQNQNPGIARPGGALPGVDPTLQVVLADAGAIVNALPSLSALFASSDMPASYYDPADPYGTGLSEDYYQSASAGDDYSVPYT